jgi:subtilisin family serine protease
MNNVKKVYLEITYTIVVLIILGILGMVSYSKYIDNKYPWQLVKTQGYKLLDENQADGVTIAFLDTGIHPDLANILEAKIVHPYNFVLDNTNIDDTVGHGTEIVCIVSCSYEENGIYGLASKAKIMPLVVMGSNGFTSGEYISKAIYYAVDNGADIINISMGSRLENEIVKDAINFAYENNVIVIAAAGDYQEDKIIYPARYDSVIAVQAQSILGVKYIDSSWGDEVDLLVPGELIDTVSIDVEKDSLYIKPVSGSSISTAVATSIIALMINNKDSYNVDYVLEYIRNYDQKDLFMNFVRFVDDY